MPLDISNLPPVLTAEEVCQILRLKRSTFYDLVSSGSIPAVRLGRQVRVTRKTILDLLGESELLSHINSISPGRRHIPA